MSGLPLSSPEPTALDADWLKRTSFQSLVMHATPGVTSALDFSEKQAEMMDKLAGQHEYAANAALRVANSKGRMCATLS